MRLFAARYLDRQTDSLFNANVVLVLLPSERECNPSLLSIFQQITAPTQTPLVVENQTSVLIIGTEEPVQMAPYLEWWDAQSVVGLAIFVLCILYSR